STVIVTDASAIEDDFVTVQEKLVEYSKTGRTVIIGFHFSSFIIPTELATFFKKTWGLNWKCGDYTHSNPAFISCRRPNLPEQYSMKALHVKNTQPQDLIYISSPGAVQSPAMLVNYGKGYLGYVGDVNTE
ncbi:hypothetical protein BGZ60DRAFT_340687, partial [Tricladium varicosporioides]